MTEKCRYCPELVSGEMALHYITCLGVNFALGKLKYNEQRDQPQTWVCSRCPETDITQREKYHPSVCKACFRKYQREWYRGKHRIEDAQGKSGRIGHARPKAG